MDAVFRTPWVELFHREEADRDVRLQAARGLLAPRATEQLALLMLLTTDTDGEVVFEAEATLDRVPADRLAALLARPDTPSDIKAFFAARGIMPAASSQVADEDVPLIDRSPDTQVVSAEETAAVTKAGAAAEQGTQADQDTTALNRIAGLAIPQRLSLAMKGSREERMILIRDPNKLVSLAVLSSPKLTESEVEAFARMTNVAEDVLRTIASSRAWVKAYAICAALVKNPKTPVALSMNLLSRLNDRDMRTLSTDRNVPEVLRATARRKVVTTKH